MDREDFMNISYHIIHVSWISLRVVVLRGKTGVCVQPRDPLVLRDETLNRGLVLVLPLAVDWDVRKTPIIQPTECTCTISSCR